MDTTLFILFGRGANGNLDPSLIILNVENVSKIHYVQTYGNITSNPSNSTSKDSNSDDFNSKGSGKLSYGTIGGITAGAALAVGSITLF